MGRHKLHDEPIVPVMVRMPLSLVKQLDIIAEEKKLKAKKISSSQTLIELLILYRALNSKNEATPLTDFKEESK